MADDLQDEIRETASEPAKASGDAGSVEQHKLTDQITADKHLAGKNAVAKPHHGLRFNIIVRRLTACELAGATELKRTAKW